MKTIICTKFASLDQLQFSKLPIRHRNSAAPYYDRTQLSRALSSWSLFPCPISAEQKRLDIQINNAATNLYFDVSWMRILECLTKPLTLISTATYLSLLRRVK